MRKQKKPPLSGAAFYLIFMYKIKPSPLPHSHNNGNDVHRNDIDRVLLHLTLIGGKFSAFFKRQKPGNDFTTPGNGQMGRREG